MLKQKNFGRLLVAFQLQFVTSTWGGGGHVNNVHSKAVHESFNCTRSTPSEQHDFENGSWIR